MARLLTPAMIAALTGQQTDEVFVVLVTFTYKTTVFRFSSDPTVRHSVTPLIYKTVSGGLDYYYVPMAITLPGDTIGSPANAQLSVSNVGLELINILRSMNVGDLPATVDMRIVLASAPDTVGYSIPTMDMVQADWDEQSVNLTLNIEALDREPFPAGNFDPSWFPALF
jgi:hypothetical protein